MTSKVEIREKELKDLSVIFANWIGANSAVSDDWLNSINTYYNIELTRSETLHLFTLIMCMLIDLTISRLGDLIEPKEKAILEKNIIEHIAYIQSLLNTGINKDARQEARDVFENSLYELLEVYRNDRLQQNVTIPEIYLVYLLNASEGQKLPERVCVDYINHFINTFEKRDFRKQINEFLNKLSAK
jgi:hypothetical protein